MKPVKPVKPVEPVLPGPSPDGKARDIMEVPWPAAAVGESRRPRAAIRSLRLAAALQGNDPLVIDGLIHKANKPRRPYSQACFAHPDVLDDPQAPFDIRKLSEQVRHECVFETDQRDENRFGGWATNELSYCNTMIARILDLTQTGDVMDILDPVGNTPPPSVLDIIDQWLAARGPRTSCASPWPT